MSETERLSRPTLGDIEQIVTALESQGYIAGREIATAIFLSIELHKPLLVEGAAGVGKTEIAKVMARALGTDLIRLQCYEGLDVNTALYEWNYQKQMLRIRLEEQTDHTLEEKEHAIFSEPFLLRRPLLQAITHPRAPVLLIDEIDRCVTGDTLVATVSGPRRAAEIVSGDVVVSFDPARFALTRAVVKEVIPHRTDAVLRLLVGGRFLEVTPEHKFVRFRTGGHEIVEAKRIRPGDRIPLCKVAAEALPEEPNLSMPDGIMKLMEPARRALHAAYKASGKTYGQLAEVAGISRSHLRNVLQPRATRASLRWAVLERLCRVLGCESILEDSAAVRGLRPRKTDALYELLGYIIADGGLASARLRIVDRDVETLRIYARKFEDALGRAPRIARGPHRNYELSYWSLPLGRWLSRLLGDGIVRSRSRRLPEFSYQLPTAKRAALVRGFFDGKGWVSDHQVAASSSSPYLLVGVQQLLTSLGVDSHISRPRNRPRAFGRGECFVLSVADVGAFSEAVGFCSPAKRRRLAAIVKDRRFARTETLSAVGAMPVLRQPHAGRTLDNTPKHQTAHDILAGRALPNLSSLRGIAQAFGDEPLKEVTECGLALAEVRSVEVVEQEQTVYDFVLDGSPYFVANQVVTHNCDEEFEAFLLEVLSDWQVTIPEIGTIRARHVPYVVLTSNRTRELSDALRRRCLYLWIDYPDFHKELRIVRTKVPGVSQKLAEQITAFMHLVRGLDLQKVPGVAETLDWSAALMRLHRDNLDRASVEETIGCICKHQEDQRLVRGPWLDSALAAIAEAQRNGEPMEQALQRMEKAVKAGSG